MGHPMAKNLLKKFPAVTVYDRNPSVMQEFPQKATSLGQLFHDTNVIITMLPTPTIVRGVYEEMLAAKETSHGRLFIDSSTVDPETSRILDRLATSQNPQNRCLDAPVSGGVRGAQQATLTFMVGGSKESSSWLRTAKPLLRAMGKTVFN